MRSKEEILASKMASLKKVDELIVPEIIENKMKVFKMNDSDWVAAETEEQAKLWYANDSDFTEEEVDAEFEGEVSLDNRMYYDGVGYTTFAWVIETDNITQPCVIATIEF